MKIDHLKGMREIVETIAKNQIVINPKEKMTGTDEIEIKNETSDTAEMTGEILIKIGKLNEYFFRLFNQNKF